MSKDLCCEVNPSRTCKTCKGSFCSEHVFTSDWSIYSSATPPNECVGCHHNALRLSLFKPRSGMTFADLYLELRKICPKGYLTVSILVQEGQPGIVPYSTEWSVYHEKYLSFRGTTPEQVLASFKAKLTGEDDPQVTPLGNINV